jgi:kinesin family protein 4/21/27
VQKLQQLQASSEEERRRLEAQYKEKLKTYDEKLRDVRRKERDFIVMQKLKLRTEVCVSK